ncbi:MAG: serine hydrolase domain-containing protein [Flavisolibacter sp.]
MSYKLRFICLKFSSILVFLLFLHTAFSQSKSKKDDREYGLERYPELDAALGQYQKLLGNNLVAMVWTDTLVFRKEMGDFNSKTEAPVASASKWLTAALILELADEGKLSLDDKVSHYLPIFESYGKNYITIRNCLSHFTGIASEPGIKGLLENRKYASLEEEVTAFAKKEIQSNPGTEFRYSNIGLNIAGRIAEVVTKKKFDQLIKQKIFNPLGMSKTTFSTLDGSAINPSGGARSTAADYMHFLQMLLQNGQYNGKQVLSPQAIKEMRTVQTTGGVIKYAPKVATGFEYALGSWVLEENAGQATALACPGLFATWPMVDWCRGYACLFFAKTLLGEQKADAYMQMKEALDEKRPSRNCAPHQQP